jgi:hypothetical protein
LIGSLVSEGRMKLLTRVKSDSLDVG